ncbi:insulin receptor substrate 1-like [Lineus longissimus]|uniref:insulin receptor substrate 1-like n=1 Tax=Lineus longissimus TaxID=88925 RepID=UPI00315C7339
MDTPRDGSGLDIRKMGVLKKLKTNKKKFFVLRQSSSQGPARIEYYDTEKKFKNNSKVNRSIELKACFNISKKQDTKHKYAIALYTKDDCFSLVMESLAEQEAWLQALTDIQNEEYGDETSSRLVFDFVWQVTVKNSGLGLERGITGRYRLCLSDKFLGLMKMSSEVPELSFQLNVIRKCGHTEQFFVLEVGRSSPIGAGELLMQVDDILIAQQMHEEILSAMKAAKASQEQITFRPRTRSAIDKNKPGNTRSSTASTSPYQNQNVNQQDQMRGRTMSEGQKSAIMSSPRARLNLSPKLADGRLARPSSTYTRSGSMTGASPFSSTSSIHGDQQGSHRYRSDSTGSRGTSASGASVDEMDASPVGSYHGLNRSLTPDYPIREEGTEDYLTMSYSRGSGSSSSASTSCSSLDKRQQADTYMDMAPGTNTAASQDASEYVDMSAGSISSSKSSLSSVSRSGHSKDQVDAPGVEDCGYVDMGSVSQSLPTVRERTAPEGYCEMTAGQDVYSRSGSGLAVRPDKVYSYLSEEPLEDFPKRAYSVGSKPDLKLKPRPYLESIVLNKTDSQKSSSAPHLNSDKIPGHQKSVSQSHSPVGSQSPGSQKSLSRRASREDSELFMEMSFDRPRTASESHGSNYARVRTSSWGQNFRPRSSSHSQAQRTYRRTPDSKHSSQELKKDSRTSSQEMGSHELHSKHHSSSESVKRGSQESLKKISHERQGSIEKAKRAAKDNADDNEYMMALPATQKSMPVPPVITGVANVAAGEDYLAMSPGSYQVSYGPRHSPTSLRRSPILEGESVTFGVEDKYGRGQGNRAHHSLTPGKSGSMKVRKEGASSQKMRRGYSADSSENCMVLGFGEKSKSWRDESTGGDSYLLTASGKDVSNSTVVTAAMMDKIVSPYGPSHMRNKSPLSVGSHSSVDSSDDYCTMETDSSSRFSDTGSNSSGCFDPFQLIRKPEFDQSLRESEKKVSRKLDYDSVKSPSDSTGLKTLDSGAQRSSFEVRSVEPPDCTPKPQLPEAVTPKPQSPEAVTPKPQSPEAVTPDSKSINKPDSKMPVNREEKKVPSKCLDPFGLYKPEPVKPDVSHLPSLPPLDISNYPMPSIPCPRSPLEKVQSVFPEDLPSRKVEDLKVKRSSLEGATSKPGETSPSAFVPGQRRSLSDLSPVEKSNPVQFNRSISNQSTTSEEHKLNYAALDLDSSEDLRATAGPTKPESDGKPLQYAQIDFVKSEGLKSSSSNLQPSKSTKPPF